MDRTVTRDVVTSRPPSGEVTRIVTGLTPGLRVLDRQADLVGAGRELASVSALAAGELEARGPLELEASRRPAGEAGSGW